MPVMRKGNGKLTAPGWITGIAAIVAIVGGLWALVSVVRSSDIRVIDTRLEVHHDTLVNHAARIDTLEKDFDTLKRDQLEMKKDQRQALNLTLLIAQQIGVPRIQIEAAMISPDSGAADTAAHP